MYMLMCLGLFIFAVESTNNYAYGPRCPGANKPLHITEGAADKFMFAVLQIHEPATSRQIAYMHRRRYVLSRAARGIGTDPEIDFNRRKTMVFMDGYLDSTHANAVRYFMGNFAAMGYNTIAVDALLPYSFAYPVAVRASYAVGNITAKLLRDLTYYGLKPKDVELVGTSLGGQALSIVAKHFFKLTGHKVGRIFSMDPSGPCYQGFSSDYHLSPNDADFVHVVHTGIDGYGMAEAQGHVDFYINGGEFQILLNTAQPVCDELCSHLMGGVFTYTSIRLYPDKFIGVKCKSVQQAREHKCYENYPSETNVMGLNTDQKKPGIYYVPVMAQAPFYAPDDWLEKKLVYPLIHHDAMSDVEHFILFKRSLDFNLSPPEFTNEKFI